MKNIKSNSVRTAIALLSLTAPVAASAIGNVGIEKAAKTSTSSSAPVSTLRIGNVGIE